MARARIKAIIFDIGGVLHPIHKLSTEADVKKALAGSQASKEEIDSTYLDCIRKLGRGEITEEGFWNDLCSTLGVEAPKDHGEILRKRLREDIIPFTKTFDLINRLKGKGYKVYALSNTILPHSEVIEKRGWYGLFEKAFLSHETGLRKPDLAVYKHVLSELGIKPEESIFIDDLEENLVPARSLGMRAVLAESPEQIAQDIDALISE